jgi:hypothetical protein
MAKGLSNQEIVDELIEVGKEATLHHCWIPAVKWVQLIKANKSKNSKFDKLNVSRLNRAVPNRLENRIAYDTHCFRNDLGFYRRTTGASGSTGRFTEHLFTMQDIAFGGREWVETMPAPQSLPSNKRPEPDRSPVSSPARPSVSTPTRPSGQAAFRTPERVSSTHNTPERAAPNQNIASDEVNPISQSPNKKQDSTPCAMDFDKRFIALHS